VFYPPLERLQNSLGFWYSRFPQNSFESGLKDQICPDSLVCPELTPSPTFSNHNLKYIFTQPDLNIRQQRWLELIKDYELEVHYHPGQANIIAHVLSPKAHCNYLPVVRLMGEESITRVLPSPSLFNITLMPTLRDEIKAV
jgi:hypothetical protein